MDDAVFSRLLGEIKEHKTPVRFIRWGEPLLHPHFMDYLKRLAGADIITHLNTNGTMLDEEKMDSFISIPLSSIKFSFQGVDRMSYREMRNRDYFEELVENIETLFKRRNDRPHPYISVSTTITHESAKQVEAFRKRLLPITDQLGVGRTKLEHIELSAVKLSEENIKTLKRLKNEESVVKKHPHCPEVFDKLSINWDGTVSACCGDYDNKMLVGSINESSLEKIWSSRKLNGYRKLLAAMKHDSIELCGRCYDYMGLQTPGLQKV